MRSIFSRALLIVAIAGMATSSVAAERRSVAVLEYRAGVKSMAGLSGRLSSLLLGNAAVTVIDLAEARRRAGARIDGDVMNCSGEATCVARLGATLKVDEVLLVGVSQLGDLVLSFQRIDVLKHETIARLAATLAPDGEPTDTELLLWLRQLYPPEMFLRYGAIKVSANVEGAAILFNGTQQGRTPIDLPLRVSAPATYQVKVNKQGFEPFVARLDVVPDSNLEVRATLVRLNEPTPWYKRWYVWALIGGAAAAAGTSLAIYYGTRIDETPKGVIVLPAK